MKEISIYFENCYGIGKLEHSFDFTKTNTFLVYAPNGTMKTSLAKTFKFFSNKTDKDPCDQIYPDRTSKFELKFDGKPVSRPEEKILIIDPEHTDYDGSDKITNFIASKELKEEYDKIYSDLEIQKAEFLKKLKGVSQSSDCEEEVILTFRSKDNDGFFDVLDAISPSLEAKQKRFDFRYNDIFDKKGNVKKFLDKHKGDLDTYVTNYESLISQSDFFKKSDNSFGTYHAGEILKSIEDGAFFDAGHTLDLKGNKKISSSEDLKKLIEDEIAKIVNDKALKTSFDKVDKAIGANAELRNFKLAIEKDNLLLVELKDYENFKKKAWLGYLYELKDEALALHLFYSQKKDALAALFVKAKKEIETWKDLIEQFNARFYVPFTVELANQEDVLLKQDKPVLHFTYSDRGEQKPMFQEKNTLFGSVLSRGERKAFYILQILFDIESRKIAHEPTLVVFDDVADSFDYKNKYAIIEYIKDLNESEKFKIILLTHNFDFYRTVASRLRLKRRANFNAVLMAVKHADGTVTLKQGQYVNDIFQHFLTRANEERVFISLIPFLRNIVEHTEGDESTEYGLLTKCLHIKDGSDSILVSEIIDIWSQKFPKHQSKFEGITYSAQKIVELIINTADGIAGEQIDDEIKLENKIVLAIAIRLKAEQFMLKNINSPEVEGIEVNQTQQLLSLYKKEPAANKGSIKILNKVALMTPENIHLNAFMYEPLIDMSVWHLVDLYKDVSTGLDADTQAYEQLGVKAATVEE